MRGNSSQKSGWGRHKETKLRVEGGERERKASLRKCHQALSCKTPEQLSLDSVIRISRTVSERWFRRKVRDWSWRTGEE